MGHGVLTEESKAPKFLVCCKKVGAGCTAMETTCLGPRKAIDEFADDESLGERL
jgi:hypothetical protein